MEGPSVIRAERARRLVRGLYGIADAGAGHGDPVGLGADLLAGGCRLVQLRAKGWSADEVERAGLALQLRCARVGAALIINDHAEVARAVDALGVHVGQEDAPTATVRATLLPHQLLGRSSHDPAQAVLAAKESDYVAFGPIFATTNTVTDKGVRGLHRLAEVRAALGITAVLVAIGGLDDLRIPAVRQAGADAWAVIGAIGGAPDRVAATRRLMAISPA